MQRNILCFKSNMWILNLMPSLGIEMALLPHQLDMPTTMLQALHIIKARYIF